MLLRKTQCWAHPNDFSFTRHTMFNSNHLRRYQNPSDPESNGWILSLGPEKEGPMMEGLRPNRPIAVGARTIAMTKQSPNGGS